MPNRKVEKIPGVKQKSRYPTKTKNPQKIIDWNVVELLFISGCNITQAAERIGVNPSTLSDRFYSEHNVELVAWMQSKHAKGNAFLHEWQFSQAKKGNVKMLMHLGEHRLGQVKNKNSQELIETIMNLVELKKSIEDGTFSQKEFEDKD